MSDRSCNTGKTAPSQLLPPDSPAFSPLLLPHTIQTPVETSIDRDNDSLFNDVEEEGAANASTPNSNVEYNAAQALDDPKGTQSEDNATLAENNHEISIANLEKDIQPPSVLGKTRMLT